MEIDGSKDSMIPEVATPGISFPLRRRLPIAGRDDSLWTNLRWLGCETPIPAYLKSWQDSWQDEHTPL